MKNIFTLFFFGFLVASCSQELEPVEKSDNGSSFFDKDSGSGHDQGAETIVFVKEILDGTRYSYLKVEKDGNEYWISTLKQSYEVGETYFYTEAIHKTNFYSTEFNRNFEDFYLVSDLQPMGDHSGHEHNHTTVQPQDLTVSASETKRAGSVTIKELISNSKKYVGKNVQVTGKVIKVNANIMDRHWVHIKDASYDSYDFVLTTNTVVPIGHIVTFKGQFNQNVDFGSGYKFDFILENATTIK